MCELQCSNALLTIKERFNIIRHTSIALVGILGMMVHTLYTNTFLLAIDSNVLPTNS